MARGLTKRRWYKPERAPARMKGSIGECSPISCPDATKSEVLMALSAVALDAGVAIGRGGDYDKICDKYTVIGKSLVGGKACDIKIDGGTVGEVILACRMMRLGQMDPITGHLIHEPDGSGILIA